SGFVRITGRIKEIIILPNGKNVNPEEMENEILSAFPLVKDVGIIEHEGKLFAVIYPDFAHIRSAKIANIKETVKWEVVDRYNVKAAHHKKILDFAIVENELPRTRVGKLRRFALAGMITQSKASHKDVAEPTSEEYLILKESVEDMLGIKVKAGDHMELDLNMDSLDRVELQVRVEGNFGIKLSNDDISQYPRLCDLAEYIHLAKTKMENEKTDWGAILRQGIDFSIPRSNYMMKLLLIVTKPLMGLYFRIKPEGVDRIPKDTPVIFAPNHQSYLDGLVLTSLLKRRMRKKTFFFAKDRNFKSHFRRFFANKANIILLNINKDLKGTLQTMASISSQGNNIVIFPEGARSRDGKIMPFKKTFAILSKELNIPVVPVVIEGTYEIFSVENKIPKPGRVHVKFLDPIYPGDKEYEEIAEATHNSVLSNFKSGK
ncbi:MAG: 1-acyl-sn-glycerol-3-phosphate acyltransferase, partial [Spirochaetota bacterium]